MALETLTKRQRAFLTISLLVEKNKSGALLDVFNDQTQKQLRPALTELLSQSVKDTKKYIIQEIQNLSDDKKKSILDEIHPDWMVEMLAKESARMVSILLRYLPGEKASYLLEKLPQSLLKEMPSLSETFSLDAELALILKKKFETQFESELKPNSSNTSSLDMIASLPMLKLKALFLELGTRELARSLLSLKDKATEVILSRLSQKDVAQLKKRMVFFASEDPVRLRQAQTHMLSLDFNKGAMESLILGAGFLIFAKAILHQDLLSARKIQLKLPLIEGRIFKGTIDQNIQLNTQTTVMRYRKEIIEAAKVL